MGYVAFGSNCFFNEVLKVNLYIQCGQLRWRKYLVFRIYASLTRSTIRLAMSKNQEDLFYYNNLHILFLVSMKPLKYSF